jgi:hypothetical protein
MHPAQPSYKPSVQSMYLRTLILDVLNTGNLTKVQMEVADGWFSSWCNAYSVDASYAPAHHLFYVDLASESGMHLMRKDVFGDALRFVRADAMKAQLAEVQAGLRQGRLYAGFGAGSVFPVEQHTALLAIVERLYQSVLSGGENRIEERTHFEDREVDVTVGIDRVLKKAAEKPAALPSVTAATPSMAETVELSPAGMSLQTISPQSVPVDAGIADPEVERWRVFDLSSKGYGLLVDRAAADNVMLNGVLALKNHETGGWIIGTVVRKLANRARGEILIGVEVLSYRPVPVTLKPAEGGPGAPALYLPERDDNGKRDAVLVRTSDFRSDRTVVVQIGTSKYHLRMNRVIRKGVDWVKARFEIEKKA